ncbi:helix-turn-helix transcriptional regulator [Mycolicibacterium sp. S2-37]|uniref:helix-turn-helix transcriptional regulator n=1 Tax=Mycolicibacterium sp. S2-37 TaxID=2810297 RepID=UPI0027DA217D|nr:helix-turn-helix transcriptional regulator [Mycolicibacterium sp. S2-37]
MAELGVAIRAWRDRLSPSDVGLPAGSDRRTPGLRREEVALLSGLSVDYLVRLEQGRAKHPSAQVLSALARALRLTRQERDALYRAAGIAPPSDHVVPTHLSPGLQRILDHLHDTPVGVFTAAWDLVIGNRMWTTLFGEPPSGRASNLAWRAFVLEDIPLVHTDEEADDFARELVSDLHAASSRYPHDSGLTGLVEDLRRTSSRFENLWGAWQIAHRRSDRKTIDSPVAGPITVDCDVLAVADSSLRLVVYTARAGSEDAQKLDLLRIVGTQVQ